MLAEAALIHCAEGFADFQLAAASLQPAVHMEKNLNGVCVCVCVARVHLRVCVG